MLLVLLLAPAREAAAQGPPPVEGLQCQCFEVPDPLNPGSTMFLVRLTWRNSPIALYDAIEIFLDGEPVAVLPGNRESHDLTLPLTAAGPHSFAVVGVARGERSPPATCSLQCLPAGVAPGVENLVCRCEFDPLTGLFLLDLTWTLPAGAQYIGFRIRLSDGRFVDLEGGGHLGFQMLLDNLAGPQQITVLGLEAARQPFPVSCFVECRPVMPVPPVLNLVCRCRFDPAGGTFIIEAAWMNPAGAAYAQILVLLDGQMLDPPLPGDAQSFVSAPLPDLEGPHVVAVVALAADGMASPEVSCGVDCVAVPQTTAVIGLEADRIFLNGASPPFAEMVVEGLASTDANGGRALRYFWSIPGALPGEAEVEHPRRQLTRVRFSRPGLFTLALHVRGAPDFDKASESVASQAIEVVPSEGGEPGKLLVVLPLRPELLTGVAERRFRSAFTLLGGVGPGQTPPRFEKLAGPRGLDLDPLSGVISWVPRLVDAGEEHRVRVRVASPDDPRQDFETEVAIRVLDPAQPVTLFEALRDVRPGAGGLGLGEGGGAGAGGGASLVPAPAVLADHGPFEPPLDLYLFLGEAPACSVAGVVPDEGGGGDLAGAIRFAPTCEEGGDPFSAGGVYLSGASASAFVEEVDDGFTVELWLANVPDDQPWADGAAPASIFSMAETDSATSFNWRIGAEDGGRYVATVRTVAGNFTIATDQDFSGPEPHHLVYVREGAEHRFYVDGVRVEEETDPGDLLFDADFEIFLGNDPVLGHAFAGDVVLWGVYPEAFGDALVEAYFLTGSEIPSDVPGPTAEICPDPSEVNRGDVEADGAQSAPGIGGGGGGGGGGGRGGGAGGPECSELLRPFEWELHPSVGREDLSMGPMPGEEECYRVVAIGYDWEADPPFDLEVELTVTQVPIRGLVRSDTDAKTVSLPSPDFRRGAVLGAATVDIGDPLAVLFHLFAGAPEPACLDAGDADDSGALNVTDCIHLLEFLFRGGSPPLPPFADCGVDPTADTLHCGAATCE
jgi:hypothetical protein